MDKLDFEILTEGGFNLIITRSKSGLWNIMRSSNNPRKRGAPQKTSSYSLELAIDDMVQRFANSKEAP
jgi:hypothetical protein